MAFFGNCRVTGIGSLPHSSPADACEFVLTTAPDLPYWPQLPQMDEREGMVDQFTRGLPGIEGSSHAVDLTDPAFPTALEEFYARIIAGDVSDFALADYESSALVEFASRAADATISPAAFKGQITGPVTLSLQLTDKDKRFLIYDDTYREVIVQQLVMKGKWLEQALTSISPDGEKVIFLDEPLLYTYGSAHFNFPREHAVAMLKEVLGGLSVVTGIHACSNCDWSIMFDAEPTVFSFDAFLFHETFLLYGDRIAQLLGRGGNIAWGIVPNSAEDFASETGESLTARMDIILAKLEEKTGIKADKVLHQSLITPACGVGSLTLAQAERVFELAGEVSRNLSRRIGA